MIDHRPTKLVIVGASGTGKTTFLTGYLWGADAVRVHVFDHQGELADRLLQNPLTNETLPAHFSAGNRWLVYDPALDWPGELESGFDAWCDWVFDVSASEHGRKIVVVDDLQEVADVTKLPAGFRKLWQTGRRRGIDVVLVSHGLNETNSRLRNGVTEIVAFHNADIRALQFLGHFGFDVGVVSGLQPGQFVGRNIRTGGAYSGDIFRLTNPSK